ETNEHHALMNSRGVCDRRSRSSQAQNLTKNLGLFILVSWLRISLDDVLYVQRRRTVSVDLFRGSPFYRANLLRCPLRTNIIYADKERHVLNKLERMLQH